MSDLDIRLKASFKDHRKRKKLMARLGPAGVLALIDLWLTAAETHPSGILAGYTVEDIEIDAGWSGPGGSLSSALVECGFLDKTPEGFAFHDWPDHQGYLVHAEERSECAKRAAAIRWAKLRNAQSMPSACGEHAEGNAPSPIPIPTPSPNPTPEHSGDVGTCSNMSEHVGASRARKALALTLNSEGVEEVQEKPTTSADLPPEWKDLVDPVNIAAYVRMLTTAEPSMAMLACWKAAVTDLANRKADPVAVAKALDAFAVAEPKYRGTLPDARRLTADWFLGLVTKYKEGAK